MFDLSRFGRSACCGVCLSAVVLCGCALNRSYVVDTRDPNFHWDGRVRVTESHPAATLLGDGRSRVAQFELIGEDGRNMVIEPGDAARFRQPRAEFRGGSRPAPRPIAPAGNSAAFLQNDALWAAVARHELAERMRTRNFDGLGAERLALLIAMSRLDYEVTCDVPGGCARIERGPDSLRITLLDDSGREIHTSESAPSEAPVRLVSAAATPGELP